MLYPAGISISTALIVAFLKFKKQRPWVTVEARVHALGTEKPGESIEDKIHPIHSPIIHFTTASGIQVYEEKFGSEFGPAVVGEKFNVLYNPKNPKEFCNANLIRRHLLEIGLLLAGLFFLLAANYSN